MTNRATTNVTLSLSGIPGGWPLIRNVMDDPIYNAQYKLYVKEFNEVVFTTIIK